MKEISRIITRRRLLGAASLPILVNGLPARRSSAQSLATGKPTNFQIACMTLPYAQYSWERALRGIAAAGYRYVAWGTTHQNSPGQKDPVLAADASAAEARKLAAQCRDLGLEPVKMFSMVYVGAQDSVKAHTQRIRQAAAARIPFVLTFGHIERGGREVWIRNLKELGNTAGSEGVTLLIKQHGGNTATGKDCAAIVEEVGSDSVKISYDAGNVLDYENHDPIPDIRECWQQVRAFCIKDHRNTPKDEDCAAGFGEIDHYKLLMPVMRTGLDMPLACENIFVPLIPRPATPEGVDDLARRSREYLESVVAGLHLV